MSYSSFGYAFPAAPIGGGSAGSQQLLHSSRLTSFATNNSSNNNNSNNTDNASLLSGPCRLQLQGPGPRPGAYAGLNGVTEGASPAGGLYGHGLITYPRPVHGGALTDSVYRSAYVAAAAAAHHGYGPLVAAVDSTASGTVCYPSLNADGHETWRTVQQTPPGGWPYDFNMGVYPYTNSYGGLDVRRKNATRESTSTLKAWLYEHIKNPYPTKGEKIMLAIITKMTLTQVSTWFANARRRLKKENKMQWSPNKRTEEREGDDDDDNDDNDNDDDDEERIKLNVSDDVSQESLQKLALLKAMQKACTQVEPIKQRNLDLYCTAPQCVTSPPLPPLPPPPVPELSSVNHQLASIPLQFPQLHSSSPSSPSSTDPSRVSLPSSLQSAKNDLDGPAKPRIWSLADVATRGMDRSKEGVGIHYPLNPSHQRQPSGVAEPQSIRPKFQPWAEDNHWAAADTSHHPKPDDAVMRLNQTIATLPSPPSSSSASVAHPRQPHYGTNLHWSFYRTLSTAAAGPFSFGNPASFNLDKYHHQSQLPVRDSSLTDSVEGADCINNGGRSDTTGQSFAVQMLQPASATEDDDDAVEEEEEEIAVGDGGSSSEDNSTVHSSTVHTAKQD